VGLNSVKSLNLTNVYPNNNKKKNNNNNNKVKSKPLELYELAGKNKFFTEISKLKKCRRRQPTTITIFTHELEEL
jgi:hypothetical protein